MVSERRCPYEYAHLVMLWGGRDESMETFCRLTEGECCEEVETCKLFHPTEEIMRDKGE